MHIHSDLLSATDIYSAAMMSDAATEQMDEKGSRSRARKFVVLLSGNSTRNAMKNTFKAATFDQWGIFLGILFEKDENMIAGNYKNKEDFDRKTFLRYDDSADRMTMDKYHNHKWTFSGTYSGSAVQQCKNCDAEYSFS